MNNKWLSIILGILIVLFILTKFSNRKTDKTFNPNIILLDTMAVNKIFISPKSGDAFTLDKSGINWQLNLDNKLIAANGSTVKSFLNNIQKIKADRIVTKNEERWKDYEVEEENATKIELFNKNEKLMGLIIGRFNFDQMTRSATSFIRLENKPDVYAIDGFASMSLSSDASAFRNKEILNLRKEDVTRISINTAFGKKSIQLDQNNWVGEDGSMADSSLVLNYLNTIANINGSEFDDVFNEQGQQPISQLTIEGNNMVASAIINCYQSTSTDGSFVIQSSLNPESYFQSDSSGVYQRIFGKFLELAP
jgi:hypothetical protein